MTGYIPNAQKVISKVIDDEAIIIKLEDGTYYSLNDTGTDIWQRINDKNSNEDILKYIVAKYDVDEAQAQKDMELLLQEMLKEQIIVETTESNPLSSEENSNNAYTAPEMEAYRDMEDLLALDPPVPGMNDVTWKK